MGLEDILQGEPEKVEPLLKRSFRPEFLNRLEEIVYYKPLTKENMEHIIDIQIGALNKRLATKQITCELTPEAKAYAIEAAYDPLYGARPLRRTIQRLIEDSFSTEMLEGKIKPGDIVTVKAEDGQISYIK